MALIPSGVHWGTLLIGILMGWFVLPFILAFVTKGKSATKSN